MLQDWRESSLDGELHALAKSISDRLDSDHGLPLSYNEEASLKFYHNSSHQKPQPRPVMDGSRTNIITQAVGSSELDSITPELHIGQGSKASRVNA